MSIGYLMWLSLERETLREDTEKLMNSVAANCGHKHEVARQQLSHGGVSFSFVAYQGTHVICTKWINRRQV